MPVWFSVTSLRFWAHTIGNPVTAVVPAIAAPPLSTARRETRLFNNLPLRFILSSPILICRAAQRQAHPVSPLSRRAHGHCCPATPHARWAPSGAGRPLFSALRCARKRNLAHRE